MSFCETCQRSGGHHLQCPEGPEPDRYCDIHDDVLIQDDDCAICLSETLWEAYTEKRFGTKITPCDEDLANFKEWIADEIGDAQDNVNMVAMIEGMPGYIIRKYRRDTCPISEKLTILIQVCMDCSKYTGVNELEGELATEESYMVSHGICDDCMKHH